MGRSDFLKWGLLLFALKYAIDRFVAFTFFRFVLYPWNYLFGQPWGSLPAPPTDGPDARMLPFVMLAISVPFTVVGLAMTLRRLRDAHWPEWLVGLFFIPFVNLLLFLTLVALPSRAAPANSADAADELPDEPALSRTHLSAALEGIAVSVVLGAALLALGTMVLREYGWGAFVATPFLMGFFGALFLGRTEPRSLKDCLVVALVAISLVAAVLLVLAAEGALCLAMAAPIAVVLALLGGLVGWAVQLDRWTRRRRATRLYTAAWIVMPVLLAVESRAPVEPALIPATTTCEIDAPASVVWRHVIAFSELPPPRESMFLAGIAYPVRARLDGRGVGAVRYCEFSTGPFVEPITAWEENTRLAFDVTSQPDPMQEWSPYGRIHPAHLDGFFRSRRGEFRLVPTDNGRIRLEGTTWYQQDIWPGRYWRLWSDFLIHAIHRRVLLHIKAEAERDRAAAVAAPPAPEAGPAEIPLPRIPSAGGSLPGPDALPPHPAMPPVLVMNDGSPVTTGDQWRQRRAEMRTTLEYYATGRVPPPPGHVTGRVLATESVLDGRATYRLVQLTFGPQEQLGLAIGIFTPPGAGPHPAVIFPGGTPPGARPLPLMARPPGQGKGVNALLPPDGPAVPQTPGAPETAEITAARLEHVLARGYAYVMFNHQDCAEDTTLRLEDGSWAFRTTRFPAAYPDCDWGILAAWAWGVSRIVDHLETDPSIDATKLIVSGVSRTGKSAMIAAAFDDRLAMAAPVVTGGGGIGAYRFSGDGRGGKEGLDLMTKKYPNWFSPHLHAFRGQTDRLPFDQHWFLALIAPRAFIALEGTTDGVSVENAVKQSLLGARPAYDLLGASDRLGVNYAEHGHTFNADDWSALLDFADTHLRAIPAGRRFDRFPSDTP